MNLIDFSAKRWPAHTRLIKRGAVLFWQGDPVDQVFILLSGAVKESVVSPEGKVLAFGIHGAGRLLGAKLYLLGSDHETTAEIIEPAAMVILPIAEFEHELSTNRQFSWQVMRELARDASSATDKARELGFLDVQQRLKHSLINLAREHGIPTARGVKIDLEITQEEIGALIAANRTTIAACLGELRAKGYLWKEGRRLVIIPPEHIEVLEALTGAVVDGDDRGAERFANQAVALNIDPLKTLEALTSGMRSIDRSFSRAEIELPDVVLAATAMKQVLPLVEAAIELEHKQQAAIGLVVIGTVFGDIHDIGKTIVAMLLRARNFRVVDLGVNIPANQFVEAIYQFQPDILALSALTTTTSLEIEKVTDLLFQQGIRDQVKLMIGGGAVSEEYAARIGADGYHISAQGAVEMAWRLCTWK
jgi:methanogenic corrinoid protein MtbC1